MLLLFAYYIVVSLVCLITGILFYSIISNGWLKTKPFVFHLITGLVVITAFAQIVALFVPLNGYVFLGFLFLLVILFTWKKSEALPILTFHFNYLKTLSLPVLTTMVCFGLMILILNSGPTQMDDTESYHIQMIKWINEYGTVPGIANLHERFGFNSSWFSTISFFLPGSRTINFYTALNGVISVWFSAYFIVRIFSLEERTATRSSVFKIGLLLVFILSVLCWPMVRGNAATANYDFITTLLVVVLFVETVRSFLYHKDFAFESEYFLWPIYLFTVRIINYPLLLLSILAIILFIKKNFWKKTFTYIGISLLLVTPFIARNVMLSGYPFYPSKFLNIFNVDWKVDGAIQNKLLDFIKYFNRVNTGFMPIDVTRQLPFPNWIGTWFHYLFHYDKIILLPGLLGSFVSIGFISRFKESRIVQFFIVVLFFQLLSWFFIAPDPRFIYGVLISDILLLSVCFWKDKTFLICKTALNYFCIICSVIVLSYSINKVIRNADYQNFVSPITLPQPPVKEITINTITLRIPEKILNHWNPRCYATNLPCLYIVHPNLEARGKTIKDGFRIRK